MVGSVSYRRLAVWCVLLLALAGFVGPSARASEPPIPPAFGPYTNLTEADFRDAVSYGRSDRLVGTYYFYWFDSHTKGHLYNSDGTDALTTHPPSLDDFSYKSERWHRSQLEDMMAAGIDFLLPVYWGAPSDHARGALMYWSFEGIAPLVRAREALLEEGRSPPRIGLFYDTSSLAINSAKHRVNLTTEYGRAWFYATVRDFFSMIPARHWAMMDGKPMVFLYSAIFPVAYDQAFISHTRSEFAREFGGREPWIAADVSWKIKADAVYEWGGALGLRRHDVAALGPGYDHSAVAGRKPLVVDRRGGEFYEENWSRFLRDPVNIVLIETWNEFHEGSDIAESREYGRRYIELTRAYADRFRLGTGTSR